MSDDADLDASGLRPSAPIIADAFIIIVSMCGALLERWSAVLSALWRVQGTCFKMPDEGCACVFRYEAATLSLELKCQLIVKYASSR